MRYVRVVLELVTFVVIALVVAGDTAADDARGAVRALRSAYYAGRHDEALARAEGLFGSKDDATARQVAAAISLSRGELERARELLDAALDGHRAADDHGEQARDAQLLAGLAYQQGRLKEALDAAELADREASATSDLRLQGSTRLALGKILVELGDYTSARVALWDAEERLAHWPTDRAWAYLELGIFVCAVGEQKAGAALLERALELASSHGVTRVIAAAHLNLAYALRELGDSAGADRHVRSLDPEDRERPTALFVAGLVAADRKDLATANRLLAAAAADPPTDDYAMDIAFQRGRIAERNGDSSGAAARYREAVRFVDQVRSDTSSIELRPWVLAKRRAPYAALLALLAREDRRLEAFEVAAQLHARAWLDALVEHATSDERRTWLARSGGRLHDDPPPLSADELLAMLGTREALVFADSGEHIWRFHIVSGEVRGLDRLADDVVALVDASRRAPDDGAAARRLGEALIPVGVRSRPDLPLYIVANGRLDPVTFAGLRRGDRFLVEDRIVVRLPGIVALRCRKRDERPRRAVFIGDSRRDLPSARAETTMLAHDLGGESFVGEAAHVERLRASRDATLLHLAIHADGNQLAMADKDVTSSEIIAMGVAPRVTVLAGCATAASRDVEGWDALSSAFLVAGSRSVVATQTAVVDRDAMELVKRFYAHGGEQHPAAAVAAAQRELLAVRPPSAWTAFTVFGGVDATDCAP